YNYLWMRLSLNSIQQSAMNERFSLTTQSRDGGMCPFGARLVAACQSKGWTARIVSTVRPSWMAYLTWRGALVFVRTLGESSQESDQAQRQPNTTVQESGLRFFGSKYGSVHKRIA